MVVEQRVFLRKLTLLLPIALMVFGVTWYVDPGSVFGSGAIVASVASAWLEGNALAHDNWILNQRPRMMPSLIPV